MIYEITVRDGFGTDTWWRAEHTDFHAAILSGIAKTMKIGHKAHQCRVVRVELLPEGTAKVLGYDHETQEPDVSNFSIRYTIRNGKTTRKGSRVICSDNEAGAKALASEHMAGLKASEYADSVDYVVLEVEEY